MSRLRGYPDYADVSARWLTRLPVNWDLTRVRYVCDVTTGSGDTVDAEPEGKYPFYVRSQQPLASTGYTFDGEAVLTAGDGAVGEVFHHVTGKFHAHQRVYVLHRFRDVEPRFFFYYFSALFRLMCNDGSARTTVDSVRRWMVTDMPVALPPHAEQRAIADFLDEQTSRIDTLISRQIQLIATLRERRTAVFDSAFAVVPGKRERLRFHFRASGESNAPEEEVLSVYRDHGVIPKASRTDNFNKTPENLDRYLLVREGDLVVNRMKAWQGSLGVSNYRGIVSGDYEVLRPASDALLPQFAHYFLRSPALIAEYRVRSTGIRPAQWRLYWEEMREISVPVPEHRFQIDAVTHIDEQATQIDALIAKAEEHIALAKERRAALITAAVTGQIDVRTAGRAATVGA